MSLRLNGEEAVTGVANSELQAPAPSCMQNPSGKV